MHIHIINGPNLNLIGQREKEIYGDVIFDQFYNELKTIYNTARLTYYQSNIEGNLIDNLQEVGFSADGIILNAGGYTHTSVAIADAVAAIKSPVIEVHISNIFAREEFRHISLISGKCIGSISGFGLDSYWLAVEAFMLRIDKTV